MLARSARAQGVRETRVEGGAAILEQVGSTARTAALLSVLRREGDSSLATLVSAAATYARDSIAAAQALAALAWRPWHSGWQVEGGVAGAVFGLSEIGRGGNGNVYGRVLRRLAAFGLWGGAAWGHTLRDAIPSHATSVELGARARMRAFNGAFDLEASVARLRTEDSVLLAASRIFLARPSPWFDVRDATVSATWEQGPLALGASQTWRRGMLATEANQSAFTWSITRTLSPHFALVLSGGRVLADAMRGVPDAHIIAAMLRVTWTALDEESAITGVATAQLVPGDGARVLVVRVAAPESAHVEVAGSFSEWQPVPLRRVDSAWEARIALPSGRHKVAYRIDAGPWHAPDTLARIAEFNGTVGLVIVP